MLYNTLSNISNFCYCACKKHGKNKQENQLSLMDHVCAGALGACDGGVVTDSIQRSDCHVDPLCTHVKPTAIEIPQNL